MVYVLDSLSLLVEYFLLAANPRSDAYPRIVVYPYSDTGMVISSPTSIAKTLALKLVFLSIFISFFVGMCKYTINNLDSNTFLKKCWGNVRLELRMHYDGNCGAFIFLLIVNDLWQNVRIRDFFMLIFWTTM